jgi:2-haloacid dehalogenase
MIGGDSLTSDILGGNNAGIATCWVNPGRKPRRADIREDHEIESIAQLPALLEEL